MRNAVVSCDDGRTDGKCCWACEIQRFHIPHKNDNLLGIRNLKHKYLELFTTSKYLPSDEEKKNEVDVVCGTVSASLSFYSIRTPPSFRHNPVSFVSLLTISTKCNEISTNQQRNRSKKRSVRE